ncbi:MBL fold metallo-hydrolase [Pseudonocardia kujensis]|uniref:MBL fold metallo-hydrolase n=1 Tax=Pseudonocardia kujensis TaxID=1128675 RepID=UPI001E3470B9|nr:MBL fold metallo-hydrolase [Pseudonocardia kujensis]MCE0764866.1 MBL fold metallo-hydrolase [Pseudonocardia kujensis]
MRLTVLGCRSGMPAEGQASSGYLVETEERTRLLLDCGPGVATVLTAEDPALDGVVISHLHSDHCYDLLPLGKALLYRRLQEAIGEPAGDPVSAARHLDLGGPRLPLYVPQGGRTVLDRLASLFPVTTMPLLDRVFDLAFDVVEYASGDEIEIADARVSLHPLRHVAANCGVRVDTVLSSLAYTGDTGVTPGLAPLAAGVDLLLAEATLAATDTGPHGHLSGADAGAAAAEGGVGELVLTHFISSDPSWLQARRDDAAAAYPGPIRIAEPGLRVDTRPAPAPATRG